MKTPAIPYRKRRLELRVPIDRLLHRIIVQLVREHDAPDGVERPRGQVRDEELVRSVDVGGGVAVLPDAPVVRVVFPQYRL